MISWYIDSTRSDNKYINKVKETVEPYMDYFCDKLYEVDEFDINQINNLFIEILEELPILTFKVDYYNKDEFFFRYNSYTTIRFNDTVKGIKRELILNKILG